MSKTWLVARYEYRRHVWRKAFLAMVLGIPLLMILVTGGIALFFTAKRDVPVGVVDQAHVLLAQDAYVAPDEHPVSFILFATDAAARTALENDEIQAYYIMPSDYLTTGQLTFVHDGNPYEGIGDDFRDYLRASLLAQTDLAPEVTTHFVEGFLRTNITLLNSDESRLNPFGFITAFVFAFTCVISVFTTAGYLIQAIVDEKENRTMEILVTSIRAENLIAGKIIGLVGLGFTQIGLWLVGAIAVVLIAKANVPNFPVIDVPEVTIVIGVLWFIPYYVLIAALITAIGVSVTSTSEGQQMSGLVSMTSMVPFWFMYFFIASPNSPLVVALSLIPLTSPLSIIIRWAIVDIPVWQMLVSWVLLAAAAAFSVFLVGRLTRVGMLRYGQKLTMRDVVKAVRLGRA